VSRFRLLGLVLVAGLISFGVATAGSASTSASQNVTSTFTGLGFDACGAPSLDKMDAWLDSPYRAIGIYLGGSNRACPDGNLNPFWVTSARSMGWNLLPLWVGRQAPCVTQKGLQLIGASSAESQGKEAADDAVERAAYFGIGAGYPIYYDMEGYKPNAPSCTLTVQQFESAWVSELHAKGYQAGIYGSADSTIRDLVSMLETGSGSVPDDIWIARWNGVEDVFGEPVVADSEWSEHQRVHQYLGGHDETYGGVKLNIDSNYVDGAVVEAAATLPVGPPFGSVSTTDGAATVSWWENSFEDPGYTTVTLTTSTISSPLQGFATPCAALRLQALDESSAPITRFGTLLDIHVGSPPPAASVAYSSDGQTWTPIRRLSTYALPIGASSGYLIGADGSLDIYTFVPGYFALLQDTSPPSVPASLSGHLSRRTLVLKWPASTDNSGAVYQYQVTLGGNPVQTLDGSTTKTTLKKFETGGPSIYRVRAIDGSGNQSHLSPYVKVVARLRPSGLPRAIPHWAFRLLDWQSKGKEGKRPSAAPKRPPHWYRRWARWKLSPYRIAR
jgi:hypothetical protein